MNRRSFLLIGLRGVMLGAAIATGLASVKLPEQVPFVRGKIRASDLVSFRAQWAQSAAQALNRKIDASIVEALGRGPLYVYAEPSRDRMPQGAEFGFGR